LKAAVIPALSPPKEEKSNRMNSPQTVSSREDPFGEEAAESILAPSSPSSHRLVESGVLTKSHSAPSAIRSNRNSFRDADADAKMEESEPRGAAKEEKKKPAAEEVPTTPAEPAPTKNQQIARKAANRKRTPASKTRPAKAASPEVADSASTEMISAPDVAAEAIAAPAEKNASPLSVFPLQMQNIGVLSIIKHWQKMHPSYDVIGERSMSMEVESMASKSQPQLTPPSPKEQEEDAPMASAEPESELSPSPECVVAPMYVTCARACVTCL
jgi:hypothetical protein